MFDCKLHICKTAHFKVLACKTAAVAGEEMSFQRALSDDQSQESVQLLCLSIMQNLISYFTLSVVCDINPIQNLFMYNIYLK